MIAVLRLDQLNPQDNRESREQFLSNFNWTDSTLVIEAEKAIEELLVEVHDIFAKQRFDIGINTEFKVKLTPIDERPAYSQSLPTPINLKGDITVELALLYEYGTITTVQLAKMSVLYSRKQNQTVHYVFS